PAPGTPFLSRKIQRLRRRSCIGKWTPGTTGVVFHAGRRLGQKVAILLVGNEAAPRRQYLAQVIRQALIYPQKISLHGLVEIARGQPRRTPVFAIPGMRVLMSQERGKLKMHVLIGDGVLINTVIAGLMVLQPEVCRMFAQGEQPVIAVVMPCAERQAGLGDK